MESENKDKNKNNLRTIYEMLYPYKYYNEDISSICIAIHRKIKTLCQEDSRYPLLMIGRYLKFKYAHDTPISQICSDIDSMITTMKLDIDRKCISEKPVNLINMKLLDWMDITYVLGFSDISEIFIDDINYILYENNNNNISTISTISDLPQDIFIQWYLRLDKELLKDRYLDAYNHRVGILDSRSVSHYMLILEVLDLMKDGKIPINATYDIIEKHL